MTSEILILLCTCPDEATASRIAADLVESRLAACVNRLGPVRSTYRWKGQMEEASEVLLLVKTVAGRYPEIEMRLKTLHPYEVPEIIAVPVAQGLRAYLDWVVSETARA